MNKKIIMLMLLSLTFLFGISCSDAGSSDLPEIKVEPEIISFDDNNLFLNVKSNPQTIVITNTGLADLEIKKVFFQTSPDGEIDYFVDTVAGIEYADVKYPVILKNKEEIKVKIYLIPTDGGIKKATLQIDSNMEGDKSSMHVEVSASDFSPELQIDEAIKGGSGYARIRKDIKTLTVKKCSVSLDARTLINICNMGKAALFINTLKLEGGALAMEYYEMEDLNTPAKIPGSFVSDEGTCITGLAICHNGDSDIEAKLIVESNSEYQADQEIKLISE